LLDFALTELLLAKDFTVPSRQRREYALKAFIAWAKEQGVTTTEQVSAGVIRRYFAYLRECPNIRRWSVHLSRETQHSRASIVRMFLRFCEREGWLDARTVAHFDMPKRPQKVVQVFTRQHYERLVAVANQSPYPSMRLRDKALLAVLFDTGIRASELCGLKCDDVSLAPSESYIRVVGKGRREREVRPGDNLRWCCIAISAVADQTPTFPLCSSAVSEGRCARPR
jgi:site-specific recombinase XerD